MLVKTKYFGEINLSEDKIITMERGMFGFEEYKKYTILFDSEKEGKANVSWFQSVEEPGLAFPVINPLVVKEDYNPYCNPSATYRSAGCDTDDRKSESTDHYQCRYEKGSTGCRRK